MGKRELVALLTLSSWYLVMVERLFLTVPWGCLRLVIVVFPDHTHLLFLNMFNSTNLALYSDVDQDVWVALIHIIHLMDITNDAMSWS